MAAVTSLESKPVSVPRRSESPNPVDIHVGSRVRLRRTLLGFSQEKLGTALGITFQQVQKYERGTNRIGASRLFDISRILEVPISFFFDDFKTQGHGDAVGFAEPEQDGYDADPMTRKETLELVRFYYKIKDPSVRKKIFDLAKTLASATTSDSSDD